MHSNPSPVNKHFPGVTPQIFLKPGEIYVGDKPAMVATLLGSCVAVTMFVPRLKAGAICHGLLPACKGNKQCISGEFCVEGRRYVECSIRRMLDWLQRRGAVLGEIEAKVFGGSDMFKAGDVSSRATVGNQNIAAAFQALDEERVRVAASDVGGPMGRKLLFASHTGDVLLKHLRKSEIEALGFER